MSNRWTLVFIFAYLSLFFPGEALCEDCHKSFKQLFDNPNQEVVPYSFFNEGMRLEKVNLSKSDFYDPEAAYIGVANGESEGLHHYYVIVGNKRFDAGGLYFKSKVFSRKNGKPPLFSKGAIFKLAVDRESKETLLAEIDKKGRDLSCLHGICRIMATADIDLLQGTNKVRARTVDKALASGNILRISDSSPIATDMLVTQEDEIRHFVKMARTADRDHLLFLVLTGTLFSGGIYTTVHFGYLIIHDLEFMQDKSALE